MAKPLDAAPQGADPARADDDGMHNVFIKDILVEDASNRKSVPETTAATDKKNGTTSENPENGAADKAGKKTDSPAGDLKLLADINRNKSGNLPSAFPSDELFHFVSDLKPVLSRDGKPAAMPETLLAQLKDDVKPVKPVVNDGKPVPTDEVKDSKQTPEVAPPPKVVPIKSADGKLNYHCTGAGDWHTVDKLGRVSSEHADFPGKKITNVEAQPDGSVKITVDGGNIVRELVDGGRALFPDQAAFKANHPSDLAGRLSNIVWDGDKVKSFVSVSKKTNWYQVADDVWSNDPNAKTGWNGHIEIDGARGTFSRLNNDGASKGVRDETRANGISESYKPDGSMEVEIPYPDNQKYLFKFKESFAPGKNLLTNPEEVKVVDSAGTATVWKKTGANEYQNESGTKWKTEIEVKKDGTYSYKDLDDGERVLRTRDGHYEKEVPKDKSLVVKDNGKITRVKVGDDDIQIEYGADDITTEIKHVNKNLRLTLGPDGKWTDSALDVGKPYSKPDKFDLDTYTHRDLDAFQKVRMIDNVAKFRASSKFSQVEKDKVFKESDRLLNGRKDSVMNSKEKAMYAEQLFWHIENHTRNEQGSNSTCSVTALRGIAFKEQPSVVAKLAADLANDGQFTVRDGSVIKPKLDSMRVRPGSVEESFPPKAPNRSALSKLWDVGAVNVSMQRDTKDPFGSTVPKGSMQFEEVAPTNRSDCGARIVRTDANGVEWVLHSEKNGSLTPYDSPRVGYPSRIADIWNQMTGEKLTDRFLLHDNRWVDDQTVFKNLVGSKQKSEQELEAVLKSNDRPKLTQANTGILEQRFRQQQAVNEGKDPKTIAKTAGGEHLFLVTGYDAASKTVTIDNSWSSGYDVPNKAEATAQGKDVNKVVFVTLSDLYEAMRTQSAGDGSTIRWVQR
jgi:hypothetical protein